MLYVIPDAALQQGGYSVESRANAIASNIPAVVNFIVTGGYYTSGDGGGATYFRVASEPSHNGKFQDANGVWFELVNTGAVDVKQLGAIADYLAGGGTDNVEFFNSAIGFIGEGIVTISAGDYALDSASLVAGITIPSNVTVDITRGSNLYVTGNSIIECVFKSTDANNVAIIGDGSCTGNSQANAYNNGSFYNYLLSDGATDNAANIRFDGITLSNFKANWWIVVENDSATYNISKIYSNGVKAFSVDGNSQDPNGLNYNSSVICIYGKNGNITDVWIDNFFADAKYIKSGIQIFHKVQRFYIDNPVILDAGVNGAANDKGAYAIFTYADFEDEQSDGWITNPLLINPRSCGVYLVESKRVIISNPTISGQIDTQFATLPKGAIAYNECPDCSIVGKANLSDNVVDVMINVPRETESDTLNFSALDLNCSGASDTSIRVLAGLGDGECSGLILGGTITVTGTADAILIINSNPSNGTRCVSNVNISCTINCETANGISCNPLNSADINANNYDISATINKTGVNNAFTFPHMRGRLSFKGAVFNGNDSANIGLNCDDCSNIHLNDLELNGFASYDATLVGSEGTISPSLRRSGNNNGFYPNSLGMQIPTHTAAFGDFVKRVRPSTNDSLGWMMSADGAWYAV